MIKWMTMEQLGINFLKLNKYFWKSDPHKFLKISNYHHWYPKSQWNRFRKNYRNGNTDILSALESLVCQRGSRIRWGMIKTWTVTIIIRAAHPDVHPQPRLHLLKCDQQITLFIHTSLRSSVNGRAVVKRDFI